MCYGVLPSCRIVICCVCAAYGICKGLGVVQVQQSMSRYNYVIKVLPTGFMMALTFAAGNMAYLYLSGEGDGWWM